MHKETDIQKDKKRTVNFASKKFCYFSIVIVRGIGQQSACPKPHSILMTSSLEGWGLSIQNAIPMPLTITIEKQQNFLEAKLTVLFLSFYISVSLCMCQFVLLCMPLLLFGFSSGYFCKNCKILGGPQGGPQGGPWPSPGFVYTLKACICSVFMQCRSYLYNLSKFKMHAVRTKKLPTGKGELIVYPPTLTHYA